MNNNLLLPLFLLQIFIGISTYGEQSRLFIEAEKASIKTIGGPRDGAWNLWSNGEVGDYVHFPQKSTYRLMVKCYGSSVDGIWSEMGFSLDHTLLKTVTVNSDKPLEYEFDFTPTASHQRLTVSFLNDALSKKEDRNLYVLSLSIEPVNSSLPPALSSESEWKKDWNVKQVEEENKTLEMAKLAIEKNRKSDVSLCLLDKHGNPLKNTDISVELVRHSFLFGCNIYMFDRYKSEQENQAYKDRFSELFNYATVGFYWRSYEHEKGKPNYAYTDTIVKWCFEHNIRMKGHPLLWNCEHGVPVWSKGQPSSEIQRQRVRDILTHYKDKITFWEVVNEAAHLPGMEIDDPYNWARETNPGDYLIVNDYEVMGNGCPPFFKMLQEKIKNGVPFDGIGIQAHEPLSMRFPLQNVWRILDQYATLGKALHITEFTPVSSGIAITGSHVTGPWTETEQADYAVKFYTTCFAHPKVMGITWWDLCDTGSWQSGGGLLNKDLSPKPAYTALKKLIHEEWSTALRGQTDRKGQFTFRGFHGIYNINIKHNGTDCIKSFELKPENKRIDITVQ